MKKTKDIPLSTMQTIPDSGLFIKRFGQFGTTVMKPHAHRDDYYIFVLLTDGEAGVEIDFERRGLSTGDMLIVSPWQVHGKPAGEKWNADGWMLALSPELLSESDIRAIDEYSITPLPFHPGEDIVQDVTALCSMLERYDDADVSRALAAAVKSIVLSAMGTSGNSTSDRYKTITLRLRKLLDRHLTTEKSPAAYAVMLNISEVYLNEAVKESTGISVGSYIRDRVVVQAKRQLAYTAMSAKEIAYALGYDDYAYFSKLFKKSTGKSPAKFRRNLK